MRSSMRKNTIWTLFLLLCAIRIVMVMAGNTASIAWRIYWNRFIGLGHQTIRMLIFFGASGLGIGENGVLAF